MTTELRIILSMNKLTMVNWRVKLTIGISTFILIVGLYTFQSLISSNSNLLNPSAAQNSITKIMEDQVLPLLHFKKNNFVLKTANPFFPQAEASEYNNPVSAMIAVDLDNGEVLYEKNMEKKLPVASLTKIMTAIVALDLASPDDTFTVSDYAAHQIPTRIGVVPDEKLKLYELLHALLLTSANDSATVIQEGIDKKYAAPIFIKAMNAKAEFLGLTNSSFANPQGFDDPDNYSTVKDLAILSQYGLKNYALIDEIVRKDYAFLPKNGNHKQFDLYNWNGLIGVYPGAMGIKIGNTGDAGKTTVVVSERNGKKILATVLGASDIYERDLTAAELLDIGFEKTLQLKPASITREMLREKYLSWKY